MAKISPELIEKLKTRLNLSQSALYSRISRVAAQQRLPRHLAAISLAADSGINISRYADEQDLATLRGIGRSADIAPVRTPAEVAPRNARPTRKDKNRRERRRGTSVFVVHGRNETIRSALFALLRAVGLEPIEWTKAIAKTKKASPYVGDILDAAFNEAVAVVVLITPDDLARLAAEFLKPSDPAYERELTGQARANVLFEAGMAFGRNPNSTVLVQVGNTRAFSDVGGRHVVHLSNSPQSRQELVTKLANAGCNVDLSGTDWYTAGDFSMGTPPRKKRSRR